MVEVKWSIVRHACVRANTKFVGMNLEMNEINRVD
jgi:hypothetical protein